MILKWFVICMFSFAGGFEFAGAIERLIDGHWWFYQESGDIFGYGWPWWLVLLAAFSYFFYAYYWAFKRKRS